MKPGWARSRAARAMLALVALCVSSPGWSAAAEAGNGFTIKGRATSLFPGVRSELVIAIHNPFDFTIVVHGVEVEPGDASNRCDADNLRTTDLTSNVRIQGNDLRRVTVPIKLRANAPRVCEGATFPLSFSGEATRP